MTEGPARHFERPRGCWINCYDERKRPTVHKDGYAKTRDKYNDRGQLIETEFVGLDGSPVVLNKYGFAKRRRTYDARQTAFYLQLVAVEEAFKDLKGDLAIRPVPSTRSAHRNTHLHPVPPKSITSGVVPVHRLRRLLPASHAEPTIAPPGAGIDPAQCDREVCRRADARCVRTDHRWSGADLTRYTQAEPELTVTSAVVILGGGWAGRSSANSCNSSRQPHPCSADLLRPQ